jgi:formylglycine-generating enzyme required for sulfatase activity
MTTEGSPPADGEIVPIDFEPSRPSGPRRRGPTLHPARVGVGVAAAAMGVLVWFSLTAVSVRIEVEPPAEELSFPGTLLHASFAERILMRPGTHRFVAERQGYFRLEETLRVLDASDQNFSFRLVRLPGLLRVVARPVDGAMVRVDGEAVGSTPIANLELPPGPHRIEVRAPRYLVHQESIEIEGGGVEQSLEVELIPAWAAVTMTSTPTGAVVRVDGVEVGTTPGRFDLIQGSRQIEAQLSGYETARSVLEVVANQPQTHPDIVLHQADGVLTVISEPAGAQVSVGDSFPGRTPVTLQVASGQPQSITLFKPGYDVATREVKLRPSEEATVRIRLAPQIGVVELVTRPEGAKLQLDGQPAGHASQRLQLLAVPHQLRISMPGYATQVLNVTPRPGLPQRLSVSLLTEAEEKRVATRQTIATSHGQQLQLIQPGRFMQGTPRGVPGRRANETPRFVELTRPYYLGVREISNREFRRFQPEHHSPSFAGNSLDADDQPVSGVTWEEAALFCNWLSVQDGLPMVYVEIGGALVAGQPIAMGYRLPSEAEWEWAARYVGGAGERLYPWGDRLPPPEGSGNYADGSASSILSPTVAAYDDGFAVSASVARGSPNPLGIVGLGGNIAEWIHDYYTIYPPARRDAVVRNPIGPATGSSHVIRGASWQDGRLARLRTAFRDYSAEGRADVGFRIARSVE